MADPACDAARRVCRLALSLVGADIAPYKENLLLRRVRAMARQSGVPDVAAYLEWLEGMGAGAQEELRRLVRDLSVSVSGFFRDAAVFRSLEERVFPKLWEEQVEKPVRVWSAACAQGQEAYSLAISLWKFGKSHPDKGRIAVLGTDVDETALATARLGSYPRRLLDGVPADLFEGAFESESGATLRVRSEIRRVTRFQRADLLDPGSHPEGVDLIACRNLLIYLRREVQEDLILALRRALRPGGYLVLGASETVIGRPWSRLEHVDPARRIYRRPLRG